MSVMSSVLRHFLARSQCNGNVAVMSARALSRSATNREKPVVMPQAKEASTTATAADTNVLLGGRKHTVNNLEKRFLVWSGKYKSVDEVPDAVAQETVEKARNKARIKIANYMMLATIIGCFLVVISGKNAQKRGESVQQMNLDWHRQINQQAIAEETAAAAAK